MKKFVITCVATALVASLVASASAGDRVVSVSKSTLASMGFGSASVMSDVDGLAVRGKGWHPSSPTVTTTASVSGSSTANYYGHKGDSTSTNQYSASSNHTDGGGAGATGSSQSYAGQLWGGANNSGFHVGGTLVISGGTATASSY
jgi:hypothetical protein